MNSTHNILLFINAFWNNGSGLSGGDQMVTQIYRRIFKQYKNIYCYISPDGKKIFPKSINNIQFILSDLGWDRWPIAVNYIFRTIKALGCIRKKNIQVLHSSSDFLPDVLPAFIYKLLYPQTKWVVNVMHIYPYWASRPGNKLVNLMATLMQKLSLLLIRRSDVVVTLNQSVKSELIKRGQLQSKIKVIPPGIDYDLIINSKLLKKQNKYDAIFMGRMKPSKGIFDLIKIWQIIVAANPKLTLGLIGGGGDSTIIQQLKNEIKTHKLDQNIFLLGHLEATAAYALIKASKVFLLPSHEEGFGMVIAEALACGSPVIVWDLPIYEEIYGSYLNYVPENNLAEFSRQVLITINKKRPDLNKVRRIKNFIKQFSWQSAADSYQKILTL